MEELAPGHWAIINTTNTCYECHHCEVVEFFGTKEACIEWVTNPSNVNWVFKSYRLAEIKDING